MKATTLSRAMLSNMFWMDVNRVRRVARQDVSYTVLIMLLLNKAENGSDRSAYSDDVEKQIDR